MFKPKNEREMCSWIVASQDLRKAGVINECAVGRKRSGSNKGGKSCNLNPGIGVAVGDGQTLADLVDVCAKQ